MMPALQYVIQDSGVYCPVFPCIRRSRFHSFFDKNRVTPCAVLYTDSQFIISVVGKIERLTFMQRQETDGEWENDTETNNNI